MFCSQCAEELPDTAYFCLKCGVKTSSGIEAGVASPWNWEKEVEKTVTNVAQDLGRAVDTVRENVRKAINKDPRFCAKCGDKNHAESKFCYHCGSALN
ncbi:MAG: zinc-ribbon domain-containing protein [Candidatus Bathyarchaeota archaeon]|nr:zinc-ribbon domain-containing protein [Candidatus Bathyarchaeota archaeon]